MQSKYCPKCDKTKPAAQFHKRGAYLMGYCKPCQRAYVQSSRAVIRARIKALLAKAKDKPCMDCGEKHPKWAMDFDHRDPSTKKFDIGTAPSICYSDANVLEEIAKCDLVCALCHRYRTYGVRRQQKRTCISVVREPV